MFVFPVSVRKVSDAKTRSVRTIKNIIAPRYIPAIGIGGGGASSRARGPSTEV